MTLRAAIEQLASDEALRSNLTDNHARDLIVSASNFLCALDALGLSIDSAYDGLKSEIEKANQQVKTQRSEQRPQAS